MSATAGWYDDPSQAGQLRYWDGERWTEHTHVNDAPTPPAQAEQGFAAPVVASAVPEASSASPEPLFEPLPQSYAQATYNTPTYTPKRGLGAGAIVLGVLALLGLIGAGIVWAVGSFSADPDPTGPGIESLLSDAAQPTEQSESPAPTTELGTAEHADIPADYAIPEGFVESRHAELGVVYGVPAEWFDMTEMYRPYFGDEPQLSGGELVTFLSAWTPDAGDGMGTDEVLVVHSALPADYTTEMYSVGARRGFDYTAGAQTWSDARTYTNDHGISVTASSGTPVESGTFVSTDMYVIGGGENMVLVQCTTYVESGNCAAVEQTVATMWVG